MERIAIVEKQVCLYNPDLQSRDSARKNACPCGSIVPYELSAEYIIDKLSAYSIRDDNRKIPIDCGKCHVKHDVTILLT